MFETATNSVTIGSKTTQNCLWLHMIWFTDWTRLIFTILSIFLENLFVSPSFGTLSCVKKHSSASIHWGKNLHLAILNIWCLSFLCWLIFCLLSNLSPQTVKSTSLWLLQSCKRNQLNPTTLPGENVQNVVQFAVLDQRRNIPIFMHVLDVFSR